MKRILETAFLACFLIWGNGLCRAEMKAGFAERDITPLKGMERPGGYGKAYNQGEVHDPLKARAVVFDDGSRRIALVGLDTAAVPAHLVKAVRAEIQQKCGIAPEAILVAASHTHSGGPLEGTMPGEFDGAPELVRKLAYEHSGAENQEYVRIVHRAVVEAVVEADRNRVSARACAGTGREEKASFNRRFRMRNGLTYTHPNNFRTFGNPDILEPAGPIDPEVGVIGVWSRAGHFLGCVVNYANHATNGPGEISADYIHYIEKTVRGVMGEKAVVVFLNGACGDVTQVDNRSPYEIEFGERSARAVGTAVGAEALKVLTRAEPGDLMPIRFRTGTMEIPYRPPAPETVKKALAMVSRPPDEKNQTEWTFAKETVLLHERVRKEASAHFEIQAIQIGPVVLLANPSELFAQLGLDLKARSTFPLTMVVELANGIIGYVPTVEAFSKNGGGYETRLTYYSNLEVQAGPKIVDGSRKLIDGWQPGVLPEPPRKAPFKEAWDYGSVPPELK
jgi:neutral ceramidase